MQLYIIYYLPTMRMYMYISHHAYKCITRLNHALSQHKNVIGYRCVVHYTYSTMDIGHIQKYIQKHFSIFTSCHWFLVFNV